MFKIKIWVIILAILLITTSKLPIFRQIRDDSTIWCTHTVDSVVHGIGNYYKAITSKDDNLHNLELENQQLKKRLESAEIMLKQSYSNNNDSVMLQGISDHLKLYSKFHATIARVVINVNYLVNHKLLINKGKNDGVVLGDVVVNESGVVGQVISVNTNSAEVMLITHADFKLYLQNNKTKGKMLANGDGHGELEVHYINRLDSVKIGDILVTTGLDDLYPGLVPVARVTRVWGDSNGFNSALCDPVVDFNDLQYVAVLHSYK